jgi:membrane protease YdiL (CAAX protease family)
VKNYRKLLLLLFIALATATLISPWAAALWNSFFASRPQFAQIFGGVFIAAASVLVLSSRSLLRLQFLREAGLVPLRDHWPDLLRGFVIAIASMAMLGVWMSIAGVFTPQISEPLHSILRTAVKALITALTVGFFEELFFRGMLFKGLLEDARPATAYAVANLFYAVVHFFKPPEDFPLSGLDPFAGVRFLIQTLDPFLHPVAILPGLVGLFIIGLVLSYALWRTQSLYLSIGLHAGWVFAIKMLSDFGEFARADLGWAFGSKPKIVSGVATWIGIAIVGLAVHFVTRKKL